MSEELFDVVFFGILQAGKDREIVMQNMAALFKTDAGKLAPYFAGGRKVIKGSINADIAEKYRTSLENVGLVIKIEPCEKEQSETEAKQQPDQSSTTKVDTNSITIAPVGANVIENPVEVAIQKIDDISGITMAEPGSDVLEHPREITAQKIEDISGISMAEAGADMIEHPQPKEKADIPDISELSLDNNKN